VSAIGGWAGTGAAIIVVGLCVLLMRYGSNLPSMTHPWQHRAVIVGMYSAGAALVITTAGAWVLRTLQSAAGWVGGTAPESGAGWALVTLGAFFLFAGVVVALIWAPNTGVAYIALITPLVLAMTAGGFMHEVYTFTTYPAQHLVSQVGHWAGG
jgi:hypothetical protein